MPIPSPLHQRTAPLCTSYRWKEWAGFLAPCRFDTNHEPEYVAFRGSAGLLDISPLRKYEVRGPDAAAFLAYIATRDIRALRPGRVVYTALCDARGKLIDDGTVARLDEQRFRLTTASPALWHLERYRRGFDVAIAETSDSTAAVAVQGPTSRDVLSAAADTDLASLRFFGITAGHIGGVPVEISRTGYTGDLGYEVWMPAERAVAVWDAIVAAGKPWGLLPAGLDALDMTRVEAGFILQDVDYFSAPRCLIEARKSSAFEAGLGWTVQLDRDPFVGQGALAAERAQGSAWAMVGLDIDQAELEGLCDRHGLPPNLPSQAWRTPVPVFDARGRTQVGQATSGTYSPVCKRNLALATVRADYAVPGRSLRIEHTVEFARHTIACTVVARPFFDPPRKRA